MSKVDEHFVKLYRTAGEILYWIGHNTAGTADLSAVSQAFQFRIVRRLPGGSIIGWTHLLSYTELANSPCTPKQWGERLADSWKKEFRRSVNNEVEV